MSSVLYGIFSSGVLCKIHQKHSQHVFKEKPRSDWKIEMDGVQTLTFSVYTQKLQAVKRSQMFKHLFLCVKDTPSVAKTLRLFLNTNNVKNIFNTLPFKKWFKRWQSQTLDLWSEGSEFRSQHGQFTFAKRKVKPLEKGYLLNTINVIH